MSDILEIKSGELYIHGSHIPRHEEKPWLFSASAVHKALEEVIRKKAKTTRKDEDTYFENSRPAIWVRNNLKKEPYVEKIANRTRNRIRKFGLTVGFGFCDSRITEANVAELEDKELVYSGIKGHGKKAGTYLCQHAVVDYTASIDADFRHELVDLFTQVVNGNIEEVTEKVVEAEKKAKGTQVRRENIQLNHEFVAECGKKKILPMKAQEGINIGVLGMTATKYKKLHDIPEPFNDNLPVRLVHIKNVGLVIATSTLQEDPRKSISNKEGRMIGIRSGVAARMFFENSKVKGVLNKCVDAELARMRAASSKKKK